MPYTLSPDPCNLYPPPARYHNSALSIWLSVDPMSDKYPSTSPYAYCVNNPVRLVDPNGEDIWEINEYGYARWVEGSMTEHKIFLTKGRNDDEFGERITTGIGKNEHSVCIDNENVDNFMRYYHFDEEKKGHWSVLVDNEGNREFAKKFMKEVSQHTDVEWGYTGAKCGIIYISTAHEKGEDGCSTAIVNRLASNKNLAFAFHVQHKFNFSSTNDEIQRENLKCPDAVYGIIYQRGLFDFKGNSIAWP